MAHNSDVAFENSWNELKWHRWHGLSWWCGIVKLLLLSARCVLGYYFSSPPHSLVMQGLQWSSILEGGWKIVSLFFLLVGPLICSSRSDSLGMLPSSFSLFTISPWFDSVPLPEIHSWRDNIIIIHELSLGKVIGWERGPSNFTLCKSKWQWESFITKTAQSATQPWLKKNCAMATKSQDLEVQERIGWCGMRPREVIFA